MKANSFLNVDDRTPQGTAPILPFIRRYGKVLMKVRSGASTMTTNRLARILFAATMSMLAFATAASAERPSAAAGKVESTLQTVRIMQRTPVRDLQFKKASPEAVIQVLMEASRAHAPEGTAINFVSYVDNPKYDTTGLDDVLQDVNVRPQPPKTITMSLRNVSLLDALRYVCDLADLHFRIDGNVVIITRRGDVRNLKTRFYPVDPALFPQRVRGLSRR
jgi:hypothetical protein